MRMKSTGSIAQRPSAAVQAKRSAGGDVEKASQPCINEPQSRTEIRQPAVRRCPVEAVLP
jgi:hypothetical protein